MPTTADQPSTRRRSRRVLIAVAAVGAFALAACSSSGSSSSSSSGGAASGGGSSANAAPTSDLSSFQTALKAAQAAPTYTGPTTGPKPQSGKKIAIIECAAQNTGCATGAASVKEVATKIGWSSKIYDGKGTPTGASQAMIAAINDGATGIALIAIASPSILEGMKAAKNAKVPVVSVVSDNPQGSGTGQVYAEVSGDTVAAGKAIADYFIVQSKGKANVASFHIAALASTTNRYKGFINEIKKCSGCKVVSDQTYGIVSQSAFSNLIKGTINKNSSINYIFIDVSQYATIAATATTQMGLAKKVGIAGIDCLPPEIQSIKDQTGEIACGNAAVSQDGWAVVNELIRAFAGQPALHESIPFRLLDKTIIDAGSSPYFDGYTPEAGYMKLWGKA